MDTLDLRAVKMRSIRETDSEFEAEVTTPHGTAMLTMDLSREERLDLKAVLPSGRTYTSAIDSWAGAQVDVETEEGGASILRLAAGFVLRCFEKERREHS